MAVLHKVSSPAWGLGNRILTITAHALVESMVNYGLTLTGSPTTAGDLERMDTAIRNPAARRVAGVGYSLRREVLYALADPRSAQNHYLLKVATVMDRALRAGRTQAQSKLLRYLTTQGLGGKLWRPAKQYRCIKGSEWESGEAEQRWTLIRPLRRRNPSIKKDEISWCSPEPERCDQSNHQAADGSTATQD